ncbi:metal ABC transporter ATP-binding protein [Rothia sp. HC945]|uniref:metal ABC transporter ATP-binding protein n=1 Tax=Rothia sp. HC945 TaxID=3171170 RepID=UPI003F1ED8B9
MRIRTQQDPRTEDNRQGNTEAALLIKDLSVDYGNLRALSDVNLRVDAGTVCAVLGMNGSGKSTLFKAISGAVRPTAGTVRIEGQSTKQAQRAGILGYMPQAESVDWDFPVSVRDVVLMGRYGVMGPSRRPCREDKDLVEGAIRTVGLTELADRQIGQLSGGQKKRAFLARALAQQARVLLLDEPFAGVDTVSASTMIRVLRDLASEGVAVLITVHDIENIGRLADSAVLLRGRVVYQGTPVSVLEPENLALAFGGGQ